MAYIERRRQGRWRARHRGPDGREKSRTFGRRVDAERWLAGVEVAKSRGSYVDPKAGKVTTGEWAARWLEAQRHLKPSTRARYDGIVAKHIVPRWGTTPVARIAHADVAAWVASLDGAPASVRYVHRVLHLLLDLAVRDGRIAANPATGVRLPRAARPAKRALDHHELNRLADAAGDSRTLVLVLGYVGLRWSEAAALRVGQVDLLRRRLTIAVCDQRR